jgi:hypothetical protein
MSGQTSTRLETVGNSRHFSFGPSFSRNGAPACVIAGNSTDGHDGGHAFDWVSVSATAQ